MAVAAIWAWDKGRFAICSRKAAAVPAYSRRMSAFRPAFRRYNDTASTPLTRWVSVMAARTTSSASQVRPRATAATYKAWVRSLVVAGKSACLRGRPAGHTGPDRSAAGGMCPHSRPKKPGCQVIRGIGRTDGSAGFNVTSFRWELAGQPQRGRDHFRGMDRPVR